MTFKRFAPVLLSFVILLAFILVPVKWLSPLINNKTLYRASFAQNPDVFQGSIVQEKMLTNNEYFPIYGSSELSSMSEFHPSNFFLVNQKGFVPFMIGRGGTQTLIHLLELSQFDQELKDRKIAFIVSPQWFVQGGISQEYFSSNFSLLQAYHLAFNHNIDPALKKKIIERLLNFETVKSNRLLMNMFNAEISNSRLVKLKSYILRPAAFFHMRILEKKDLIYTTFKKSSEFKKIKPNAVKNKSKAELMDLANAEGKKVITSNPFSIRDDYYKEYIKDRLSSLSGVYKNSSYSTSQEYNDFQLLLSYLKEKQVKPLFISVPVNGFWYDYGQFPKERRTDYYNKVNTMIRDNGFEVADLSSYEYEKYFLKDTMHLGWNGWIRVNRVLEDFYTNK
jgi:D-alanine transfer protein